MTTNSFQWYVLHVHSSCEKKVMDALREKIESSKMNAMFGDILIPTREVIEVKAGKRVKSDKKFFPGYIVIQMIMSDETFSLVRSIPRVMGFLGSKNKPTAISEEEAKRLLHQIEEGGVASDTTFEVGQEVRVIDGPFANFNGVVVEADNTKMRLKVTIIVFGRETSVDLEFSQVEKV